MYLGKNIQYLRKQRKITQEEFSEQLTVSRQTVAKWEAGSAIPELEKLLEICEFFSCNLDELVRKSLPENENIYSEVRVQTVKPFKMARYVMISPQPENVMFYHALQEARRIFGLTKGDNVILTGGQINGKSNNTNTIRLETVLSS